MAIYRPGGDVQQPIIPQEEPVAPEMETVSSNIEQPEQPMPALGSIPLGQAIDLANERDLGANGPDVTTSAIKISSNKNILKTVLNTLDGTNDKYRLSGKETTHPELWTTIPERYKDQSDKYYAAQDPSEIEAITKQLDMDQIYRQKLDDSAFGGWAGFGAEVLAGNLDPTLLIPGAKVYTAAKFGTAMVGQIAKTAVLTGVASGITTGIQEGVQELFAPEQANMNEHIERTATGVAAGTIFGGATAIVAPAARAAFNKVWGHHIRESAAYTPPGDVPVDMTYSAKLVDEMNSPIIQATKLPADASELSGINKSVSRAFTLGFESINNKLNFSNSPEARVLVQNLLDNNFYTKANKVGDSTVVSGVSVERQLINDETILNKFNLEFDKAYKEYVVPNAKIMQESQAYLAGKADPTMSWQNINYQITRRLHGVQDELPAPVQKMAKQIEDGYKDLGELQVKAGLMKAEDLKDNYMHVSWRTDVITKDRMGFEDRLFESAKRHGEANPNYRFYDAPNAEPGKGPKMARDMSDADYRAVTKDFTDRMLYGEAPNGARSNLENVLELNRKAADEPGFQKPRADWIDHTKFEEFMDNDAIGVFNRYAKEAMAEIRLQERAKALGGKSVSDLVNQVFEQASKNAEGLDNIARDKLLKEARANQAMLLDVVKILKGRNISTNPILERQLGLVRKYVMTTKLGGMTITALNDLATPMIQGVRIPSLLASHMKRFIDPEAWKITRANARDYQAGVDLGMNRILKAMEEPVLGNGYTPKKGRVEKMIDLSASTFNPLTLNKQWTNFGKLTALDSYTSQLARVIEKWDGKGTMSARNMADLAQIGITKDLWADIAAEVKTAPKSWTGARLIELASWKNQELANKVGSALAKKVDSTILTPGIGDNNLTVQKNPFLKTMFQFTSFMQSFTDKVILSGIQRKDAQALIGVTAYIYLSGLSYQLKNVINKREVQTDPNKIIKDGMTQFGFFGVIGDRALGVAANLGVTGQAKNFSRFKERNLPGIVMGPAAGTGFAAAFAVKDYIAGDEAKAMAQFKQMIPYQNLWWLKTMYNHILNKDRKVRR